MSKTTPPSRLHELDVSQLHLRKMIALWISGLVWAEARFLVFRPNVYTGGYLPNASPQSAPRDETDIGFKIRPNRRLVLASATCKGFLRESVYRARGRWRDPVDLKISVTGEV